MTTRRLHGPRWRIVTVSALIALAIVAAGGATWFATRPHETATAVTTTINNADAAGSNEAQPRTPGPAQTQADPAAYDIQRLRAMKPASPSPATSVITGDATQQPDLYAAEFARRLLTQDYRQPRDAHLQWVQAESATTTEPLVVGLVPPELRDRLAVYSVADASPGPAPIPTRSDWGALALEQGYTTVTIDRVEEPFAWTNAVASGRVTDPGITGREVAATVVRHTTADGRARTATFSVALTVNLEGPPVRASWGFVAAISYTSIQVS